jgi:hypothetical protein
MITSPKIGCVYTTIWSKNPYMHWTLTSIDNHTGTGTLSSKNSSFQVKLADLKPTLQKQHSDLNKNNKQLSIF